MLSGICGLFKSKVTLTGKGTLIRRNMFNVENSMNQTGAECSSNEGFPPLIIKGEIKPGNYLLDFYDSSQFLSGLLTAMPVFESDSEITVVNLQSKPYISMTLEILSRFGIKIINNNFQTFYIPGNQTYRAADVWIEGDWSGAAFMFVAGAIAGRAEISELNPESNQADMRIIEALRISGANIEFINDKYLISKSDLNGFSFDCSDCPDLFPPLAVLACGCRGLSELIGVNRLRNKESDRAEALVAELGKIGAKIRIEKNSLIIDGNERLTGGDADSRGDHRIAMALAVAGLISENGVDINNPDCVNKSYPGFFQELTYNSFILL
ncbi:MAG: 3-phosphoshikimate 1-carboxyvinyltransferase [Bacteroidota bacterium]|nr:3-phosphoshikimate 1-carboxyvinyltransferase [Bacteroidota bacterium]